MMTIELAEAMHFFKYSVSCAISNCVDVDPKIMGLYSKIEKV